MEKPPPARLGDDPPARVRRSRNVVNFEKWSLNEHSLLFDLEDKFPCSVHKSGSKILIDYYGMDLLDADTG